MDSEFDPSARNQAQGRHERQRNDERCEVAESVTQFVPARSAKNG
jgi:hypothetical protein